MKSAAAVLLFFVFLIAIGLRIAFHDPPRGERFPATSSSPAPKQDPIFDFGIAVDAETIVRAVPYLAVPILFAAILLGVESAGSARASRQAQYFFLALGIVIATAGLVSGMSNLYGQIGVVVAGGIGVFSCAKTGGRIQWVRDVEIEPSSVNLRWTVVMRGTAYLCLFVGVFSSIGLRLIAAVGAFEPFLYYAVGAMLYCICLKRRFYWEKLVTNGWYQ